MGKTGTNVELFNVPTYQCSILFNNMGSFNRKSEFRRPENLNKPVAKGEKYSISDLSLLRDFWGHNYAHVIMTAEADNLTTDAKELLEELGLVGFHSKRGNYLLVHARIDSTGYVRLLWESNEEEDKTRERSTWQLSADWISSENRERSEWRSSGSWQSPFNSQ